MKEGVVEEVANKVVDRFKSDVRPEVREIDDQKSRDMNLVVFNLPESDKSSSAERKEDDVYRFLAVCISIGVENVEVSLAFRLGNKRYKYVRPLKVILGSKKTRKAIIENVKHISNKAPENFKYVLIVKDLTTRQRAENKARRETMNRLKKRSSEIKQSEQTSRYVNLDNTAWDELLTNLIGEDNTTMMDYNSSNQKMKNVYEEETIIGTLNEAPSENSIRGQGPADGNQD